MGCVSSKSWEVNPGTPGKRKSGKYKNYSHSNSHGWTRSCGGFSGGFGGGGGFGGDGGGFGGGGCGGDGGGGGCG